MKCGNTCTHADGGIYYTERCNCTERVAADVAGRVYLKLVEYREYASVRTTGAEDRRTVGGFFFLEYSLIRTEKNSAKKICTVFALSCKELLALYVKSPSSYLLLDNRLKLLKYVYGLNLGNKFLYELL